MPIFLFVVLVVIPVAWYVGYQMGKVRQIADYIATDNWSHINRVRF